MTKKAIEYPYDGTADAERILEVVMHRTRYGHWTRDNLISAIETIVAREKNRQPKARRMRKVPAAEGETNAAQVA